MRVPHPFLDLPKPLAMGHRGCAGRLPENTLAAFRAALDDGAVILETDVHLTRDGEPVLIHDHDVDRVTEGSGAVRDLDLRDIEQLDAGYRFSPDGGRSHPERGRGHRVPTLCGALEAFPAARFNLELKEDLPGLVERTLDAIDATGGGSRRTLLVAADDALMQRIRAGVASRGVAVALGASAGEVARFVRAAARGETPEPGISALQIPAEFAGRPLVTPELVAHAHRHGVQVHVWTINEPAEMRRLLELGVDGIVSDFPARLAALIASRH
jgi:glycerophosphoryl diester phosphodiesterase